MTTEQAPRELTGAALEKLWEATFSTNNPFCPCDLRTFKKAARAVIAADRALVASQAQPAAEPVRDDFAPKDQALIVQALLHMSNNMDRDRDTRNRAYAIAQVLRMERSSQQPAEPGQDSVHPVESSSPAMSDRNKGLYNKFDVRRTDGGSEPGGKHRGCEYFVLDLMHDKHATAALRAYADSCEAEYPALAADLRAGIAERDRKSRHAAAASWLV